MLRVYGRDGCESSEPNIRWFYCCCAAATSQPFVWADGPHDETRTDVIKVTEMVARGDLERATGCLSKAVNIWGGHILEVQRWTSSDRSYFDLRFSDCP
jgi:hypothetical protein